MSYFITISGERSAAVEVAVGSLVRISDAQPYFARLEPHIKEADGSPSQFWDDDETGTSHDLVCAAELDYFEGRPLDASALGRAIAICESQRLAIRVWYARDEADEWDVPIVGSAKEAFTLLSQQAGRGGGVGFVLRATT